MSDPDMTGSFGTMADKDLLRLLVTPPSRLTGWKTLPELDLTADAEGRVILPLPDDFLMLLSLRLSNWERPVREVLQPGNWLYRLQSSRWTGLRGTPQRPLAFFSAGDDGQPVVELFSAEPGAVVQLSEFRYLPVS